MNTRLKVWALAKIPFKGRCDRAVEEREGINPSPTKKNVGAGFIPARVSLNFASASVVTSRRPTGVREGVELNFPTMKK